MGVATAAGIGAAATVAGGMMAADGARKASQSANAAAIDWRNMVERNQKSALESFDQYSPTHQATLDKAMAAQQQDISRQQSLVANIDPSLIEAGKQTKQLLDGQSAPVLNQLSTQRQTQRQALVDNLRQQVGPGAETSTLGQNQLQKFDAETANIMSTAQQSYLQQVSGLALHGNDSLSANIGAATANLSKMADQYGQIGKDRASIIQNGTNALNGANQAIVNTSGSAGQGQAMQGQLLGNLGNSVIQGAAAYYGGKGGGTPGTTGTAPASGGASSADYNPADANWQSYASNNNGGGAVAPAGSLSASISAPKAVGGYGGSGSGSSGNYSGVLSPGYGAGYDPSGYKPFNPSY